MSKEGVGTKPSVSATPAGSQRKKTGNESSAADSTQSRPKVALASNMEPTYYIGGGNGNSLIEETLNAFGWRRIKDKSDDGYRLRWCELKSSINYNTFKEGEQMVNHIPNCNLLTNKLGLLDSLQEHSRTSSSAQKKTLKLDFLPETYRLDDPKDKQTFVDKYKADEIWICKPTGRNQGKGIFLVRSLTELNQSAADTAEQKEGETKPQKPSNRIIQRYIINPLLVEGRKFDIRCYMLIASTVPYLVLYHKGYLRLSMYEYDNNCDNIIAHLTNQFIQKKDPKYNELKEETAWSMDRFNQYVNEELRVAKGIEKDWVYNTLTKTMMQIMTYAFVAVKNKLQKKVGYFDLYGLDFMIDENMKVWLIEINVNPCLATNCAALREVVPGVVRETLYLAIECFEKSRKGRPILPLQSLKEFHVLYTDAPPPSNVKQSGQGGTTVPSRTNPTNGASIVKTEQSKPTSPVRRARSMSPFKDGSKQTKKPETTTPSAVPPAKNKPPETLRDAPSIRMTKGARVTTTDAGDGKDAAQNHRVVVDKQTDDKEERERAARTKMSPKKRNPTEEVIVQENVKEKVTKGVVSADKTADKNPTSAASVRPTTKTVPNGSGSIETKASKPAAAAAAPQSATGTAGGAKQGNSTNPPKKKLNPLLTSREEKPNRGS